MTKRLLALSLLLSASLFAATIKVGPSANSCPASSSGACDYTSIKTAITHLNAAGGDTITVYGDITNKWDDSAEGIITLTAGVDGTHYNTVQVNTGDTVTTKEWIVGSYDKVIGFSIQDPATRITASSAPCISILANSQYVYITGNTFYACGGNGMVETASSSNASYVYIQNNTFSYPCGTTSLPNSCHMIMQNGDHWLIEGNDFSHGRGIQSVGSYNVVRNNAYHDFYGDNFTAYGPVLAQHDCSPNVTGTTATVDAVDNTKVIGGSKYAFQFEFIGAWITLNGTVYYVTAEPTTTNQTADTIHISSPPASGAYTLGGGVGSACHADFWASEPSGTGSASQYNLIEANTIYNHFGYDSKGILAQGDACPAGACHNLIIRYNTFAHIGAGTTDNNKSPGLFSYVKEYNNTKADIHAYKTNPAGGIADASGASSTSYFSSFNQLYYFPGRSTPTGGMNGYNPYAAVGTAVPMTYGNNLAYCAGLTLVNCGIYGHTYSSGSWTSDSGNLYRDPAFSSYSSSGIGDLHTTDSTSNTGGGSFTTVASGCNSKALTLADGSFFQDGMTLAGVSADVLSVTSRTNKCTIASVSGNVVNCVETVACTNGDSVWLYSDSNQVVRFPSGSAPYMGALGPAQVSPYTVTASVSGSATGYISGNDVPTPISCGTGGRVTCTAGHNANDDVTYTANTVTGVFAGWGGTLAQQFGCTTASTCHVSPYPASDGTITASFVLSPAVSLVTDTPYCNVVQKSCTPTLTLSATNLGANSTFSVVDASNTPIVDTATNLQAVCSSGVVNAFCGDGTMAGPWSIHTNIANWNTSLAQQTATVNANAGGIPAASATVSVGLTGRTAGTPSTVTH